ncbi:hypothetical protein ANCDUO_07060 [Ancylostoma duodenale]|uniref:Uncharacterized protein n=1 Tax=Ancylostoma duodenale TaxID=51022 RepID=A0A0C2GZV4_9BILA|nr:hypothetical protein ANCDUO_07060 [Ancylostoma duodenale]
MHLGSLTGKFIPRSQAYASSSYESEETASNLDENMMIKGPEWVVPQEYSSSPIVKELAESCEEMRSVTKELGHETPEKFLLLVGEIPGFYIRGSCLVNFGIINHWKRPRPPSLSNYAGTLTMPSPVARTTLRPDKKVSLLEQIVRSHPIW